MRGKINVRALVILVLIAGLLAVGTVVGHKARKRMLADRALAAGKAAVERKDWPEACRQLKQYLYTRPDDAEALRAYAEANLSVRPPGEDNVRAARDAYRRLLQQKPGDDTLCAALTRIYLQTGDYGEAAYVCRQRLAVDLEDQDAAFGLARALAAQGNHEEATQRLTLFVEKYPQEVEAYALLSSVVARDPSEAAIDAALQWLNQAVDRNPASPEALVYRARLHRTARNVPQAARADLKAADDLASKQPASANLLLLLTNEWLQLGDLDQAKADLTAAERIDPATLTDTNLDLDAFRLQKLLLGGRLALLRGAGPEGAALADRVLNDPSAPRSVPFLPIAVELYLGAGRVQDARKIVDEYRGKVGSRTARGETLPADTLAMLDAAVAIAEGRPYTAVDLIERLVINRPDNASARKLLWRAYDAAGDKRRATAALEELVARQPRDAEASLALARSWRGRDWSKVLGYAEQAQRTRPDNLETRLLRLEARVQTPASGQSVEALRQELGELRQAYPKRSDIRMLQARLALRDGKNDEAVAELEQAIQECEPSLPPALMLAAVLQSPLGQIDRAIQVCRAAAERHPDVAAPWILLGELLSAKEPLSDAREVLTHALQRLEGDEKTAATYALADHLLAHGQRSEGLDLLTRLADEQPEAIRPRLVLLELPEVLDDPIRAQSLIDQIAAVEGSRGVTGPFAQARLWLRTGQWRGRQQEVESMLQRCLTADPAWSAPVLLLGDLYEKLGRYDEAERIYRRAIETNPGLLPVAARLLTLLERSGRFVEAHDLLVRLPSDMPDFSVHRVNIALGMGDHSSAMEDLDARIAAAPDDVEARILLARLVYTQDRNTGRALKLLDEAQSLAPDLPTPLAIKVAILRAEKRDDEVMALLNAEVNQRRDFPTYLLRAEYLAGAGRPEAAEADFLHLTTFPKIAAEGHAALARFHLSQKHFDKALAACEEGLKVDPASALVRRTLVRTCLASSDPALLPRAVPVLDKLLEEMPDDIELLAMQASVRLSAGTPEATAKATEILRRVVELDPRHVSAQLQLIQMALARGDRKEADERILRALRANPGNSDLLQARASLEADRGNVAAALQFARAAADADPQSQEARSLLLVLAIRARDLDTARAQVDLWRKTDPDGEATQVAQARLLAGQKRDMEAIETLEKYRGLHPDAASPDLLLLLAELLRRQDNDEASGQCISEALSRAPDNAAARLARVRWLGVARRHDELRAFLDGQSAENPGHLPIVMEGASFLVEEGSDEAVRRARALFEQVRKRYPGLLEANMGVAFTAYRLGDRDGAVQAYRRALELDPYQRQALNDLAWILGVEMEKPQEAIEFADRGVARYPDDPHLLDTRGVLLTHLGRLADARADLTRCVEIAKDLPPTEAKARLHLARAHVKLGEPAAAAQRLREASEIDIRYRVLSPDERAEIKQLMEQAPQPP